MNWRFIVILLSFSVLLSNVQAQKPSNTTTDTRSASRRFADSLYEVHTLSKIRRTDSAKTEKEDVIAPKYICDTAHYPSETLYQNTWFCDKVKIPNFQFQQIPDQIVIRLTGRNKTSKCCFPCAKGSKSSNYGWRWNRPHTGVDIALNIGEPVFAAFDGVVRVAKTNGGYGKMVLIRHYNNLETLYGHLSEIKVKSGQIVKAGDIIGLSGNTGHSTGPHLHFECRLLYACFDPEWIFDMDNRCLKSDVLRMDKSYFGVQSAQQISNQNNSKSPLTKINRTLGDTIGSSTQILEENKSNKKVKK
ncbi:MAG: M23 family metallopeptidase [Bacteroidales bacterium]|jgi:murein DD-endopeptidase MepM/ murein hydrolase activator NlpD|nr:M23 family metallopeptidase [Bacteroidales bacterium]